MKIKNLSIEIDNYENAAMDDYPIDETVRVLNKCIEKLSSGSIEDIEGLFYLRDSNGNTIGQMLITAE